uniref:THO complex subunit 2-like n=1 Tax=Saccoglossus kowalevskii TaxID=10224 RepID=A0ABM0M0P4_SACKO
MIQQHKSLMVEARQYARKMSMMILSDKGNEKDADKEEKNDQETDYQKLGLCEALLQLGDWHHAKLLMDKLPPFTAALKKPIALAMCHLIHATIEPLYN